MDYEEQSQLAAYPPPYHPPPQPLFHLYPPQQNPTLNPNPSSFHHQRHPSSLHLIASAPPPPPPPPPLEQAYPVSHGRAYTSQTAPLGGDFNVGTGGLPSYYPDRNWVSVVRFETSTGNPVLFSNSTGNILPTHIAPEFATTNYNHNLGTTRKIRHQGKISSRKSLKKTNIPQSVRCDVCKITCDTEDVLKKHRLGRKHKQNLEKLKAVVAGHLTCPPMSSATPTQAPEAPDASESLNGQTKKKKASQKAEDLETKKKRVLEGGAAMDAVRTCSICKVVCNSDSVFQYHLAGQKHAAMVKKQASGLVVS